MSALRKNSDGAAIDMPCTAPYGNDCAMQARCRGELFIECSRLDDKVPISHEEQMSTLRKVRLALPQLLYQYQSLACAVAAGLAVS